MCYVGMIPTLKRLIGLHRRNSNPLNGSPLTPSLKQKTRAVKMTNSTNCALPAGHSQLQRSWFLAIMFSIPLYLLIIYYADVLEWWYLYSKTLGVLTTCCPHTLEFPVSWVLEIKSTMVHPDPE